MSSAINHRKRSHRSHNKQFAGQRTMRAVASARKMKKEGPFAWLFRRFRKRESRMDLIGGEEA